MKLLPRRRATWLIAVVLALTSQAATLQREPQVTGPPSHQGEIRKWVNVAAVNLRAGPGVGHDVVQVLSANSSVRVLGKAGRWTQVESKSGKDDAVQGWIYGRYLSDRPLTEKQLRNLESGRSKAPAPVAGLLLAAAVGIYFLFRGRIKKRGKPTWYSPSVPSPGREGQSSRGSRRNAAGRRGGTITGKAWVTDADGIRVSRQEIRFAGVDAPEWDQWAKHEHGYWFKQGKRVKSALIREIGGKTVRVTVKGHDKYDRVLGIVTCNGKDIGAWLVRNGYGIAAWRDKYKDLEREARRAKRGMWGHAEALDPRTWRQLSRKERREFLRDAMNLNRHPQR